MNIFLKDTNAIIDTALSTVYLQQLQVKPCSQVWEYWWLSYREKISDCCITYIEKSSQMICIHIECAWCILFLDFSCCHWYDISIFFVDMVLLGWERCLSVWPWELLSMVHKGQFLFPDRIFCCLLRLVRRLLQLDKVVTSKWWLSSYLGSNGRAETLLELAKLLKNGKKLSIDVIGELIGIHVPAVKQPM